MMGSRRWRSGRKARRKEEGEEMSWIWLWAALSTQRGCQVWEEGLNAFSIHLLLSISLQDTGYRKDTLFPH
jgi:hypothetical protein